ncbi:MAG: hypothetical protein ACOYLX_22460 [Burkholderiaceae bacterium]
MPDALTALVQAGLLIAVAVAAKSRLLLIAVAAAAILGTVAYGVPASLTKLPEELAVDMTGVGVGLVIGWFLARPRDTARAKARAQRATLTQTDESRTRRGLAWTVVAMVLIATAGAAWWVQGDVPEPWRVTARGWVGAVSEKVTAAVASNPPAAPSAPVANTGTAAAKPPAKGGAQPQNTAHAERPRGDVRHCLEQGSREAVARCAERAR